MKSSRFFSNIIDSISDIEKTYEKCVEIATDVNTKLGPGHSEAVYEAAMMNGLYDCGRVLFGSRVAKREAEGTVHTKHQLNLDPNPEGT